MESDPDSLWEIRKNQGATVNKSESIKELAAALAKAQGKIKGAVKDSSNPFFKSKYADLASVVEAIRAAFSENGLSYVQTVEPSDKEEVRVETVIMHSSGEWICCGVLNVPVSKADAQGFGSALTYARRYGLSAATGVAPEDDDGNAAAKAKPTHSATDGAYDALSAIDKSIATDAATTIKDVFNEDRQEDAYVAYYGSGYDNNVMLGIWELLKSSPAIRSTLKAMHQKAKVA